MDQLVTRNFLKFMTIKNSDGSEIIHYPAFYEGVPKEFKNYAETELGETPEKMSKGINDLRLFMEEQGLSKTDEKYLLAVLRNCKYDPKKTQVKLEKFLRAKEMIAERIAGLDSNTLDRIVRKMIFTVLPYRDKHGRIIVATRPTVHGENINDAFVCYMAMLLYTLEFPMTSLFGVTYIGDNKPSTMAALYQILIGYKSWLKILFDLPLAMRKIDVIHDSFVTRWFMNITRPVTPAKIYKRITLHGDDLKGLQKTFHSDILPEEFGGNMGPMSCEHYRERFLDFVKRLKEEHSAKVSADG